MKWILAVAILVGACSGTTPTTTTRPPAATPAVQSANLPPTGVIWFGSSFDTTTFAIAGKTSKVDSHAGFSMVAHLIRAMDASALAMRIYWNGSLVSTTAVNALGSGDVWGFSPGPLFEAGTWRYDITDVGGNVLATGSVTAT